MALSSGSFRRGEIRGHAARTCLPVGAVSVVQWKGYPVRVIKVAGTGTPGGYGRGRQWQYFSRWVWEQHHGREVPAGHKVVHADGDAMNDDIGNLELVSNSAWARRATRLSKAGERRRVARVAAARRKRAAWEREHKAVRREKAGRPQEPVPEPTTAEKAKANVATFLGRLDAEFAAA